MRQKLTLLTKTMLLLCALIAGSGSAWATEYSKVMECDLTGKTYGTSNYNVSTTYGDWTIVNGANNNKGWAYFKMGGKSATISDNNPCYIYSTKATTDKVDKITVHLPSGSLSKNGMSVNSWGVYVYSNSAMTNQIDYVAGGTITNSEGSFDFTPSAGKTWASGYYYKVSWDLANTTTTNGIVCVDKITLYKAVGVITYTVTYDANGATSGTAPIDASSPYTSGSTVTVLGKGSLAKTYCTFDGWNTKADGTGTDYSAGATFSITSNTTLYAKWTDTRASADLAWSAASADVTYGANDNVFPTLTNTHNVPVTYSSSKTSAATIDGSGVITLEDYTGSTTISAIFVGNDDYLPQTVTYTLNVTEGIFAVRDGVFNFVKAAKQDPLEDYGSGMTLVSSGYTTASKTWTAGNVTMVTSKVSGNGYRWWSADGTLRFYNESKAKFSVPSDYVITKIVTTGANFDNANVGTLSSSTWTGASNAVELSVTETRNIKTITVTYGTSYKQNVSEFGWATLIAPDVPVSFAENTAYVVSAADVVNKTITVSPVTSVPAGTPVLLKGEGEKTITVATSASAPETNLLKVCDGAAAATGYNYFVLAKDGTSAAFMQWTGDLDDITGKVVLPLELDLTSGESRNLRIIDDEGTGISQIKNGKLNIEHSVFDLQGRRVKEFGIRNSELQKGLYIVNGKKVMMK